MPDEEPDDIIDVEIVGEEENPPLTTERKSPILYTEAEARGLLADYTRSRKNNMISAFTTFDDYVRYKERVNTEIVGLITSDGREITGQAKHFLERVFGTTEDPKTGRLRSAVELDDIKDALQNPLKAPKSTKDKDGRIGIRYIGKFAEVVISDTGKLISTNATDSDKRKRLERK